MKKIIEQAVINGEAILTEKGRAKPKQIFSGNAPKKLNELLEHKGGSLLSHYFAMRNATAANVDVNISEMVDSLINANDSDSFVTESFMEIARPIIAKMADYSAKGFTFTDSKTGGVLLGTPGDCASYDCKDIVDALKMAEFRANWTGSSACARIRGVSPECAFQ